jgi:hypothetical protein
VVATKANSTTVVPRQYPGTLSAILMLYPSQRGESSLAATLALLLQRY